MIKVNQLNKIYNLPEGEQIVRQTLFSNFNLTVEAGEFVAIVGPSGCGKSTLLNTIGMLDSVTNRRYIKVLGHKEKIPAVESSGKIFLDGQEVTQLSGNARAEFINQHIGFIFQFHHLIPELDVRQNVALPMRIQGKSTKEAHLRAEKLLEEVELLTEKHTAIERHAILSKKPAILSGGERQRVVIARALMNQPKILLADEPTGSLHPNLKEGIIALLMKLNQTEGITILMVTHDTTSLHDADGKPRVNQIIELSNSG